MKSMKALAQQNLQLTGENEKFDALMQRNQVLELRNAALEKKNEELTSLNTLYKETIADRVSAEVNI